MDGGAAPPPLLAATLALRGLAALLLLPLLLRELPACHSCFKTPLPPPLSRSAVPVCRQPHAVLPFLADRWLPTVLASIACWTPYHLGSFKFIHQDQRPLFGNLAGIAWGCYVRPPAVPACVQPRRRPWPPALTWSCHLPCPSAFLPPPSLQISVTCVNGQMVAPVAALAAVEATL